MRLKLRSVDLDFWRGELDNKLAQLKQEIEEVLVVSYPRKKKLNGLFTRDGRVRLFFFILFVY